MMIVETTEEWIELYNSNNFEIDLSGWKIQDSTGAQTTYNINQKISGYGFLVLKRPQTKITLNNGGDALTLLQPDSKVVSSISFPKAPSKQSYSRVGSAWQWSSQPTPGTKNVIPVTQTNLSKNEKSDTTNTAEVALSSLSQTTNLAKSSAGERGASPWFLFFTALAVTIISASAVLFIKLKLNQKDVRP